MRFFEIYMAAAAAISILNLIFSRGNHRGYILPAVTAVSAAISIVAEGFRIFMLPAYLLSLILLVLGISRSISYKKTSGSKPARSPAFRLLKASGAVLLVLLYIAGLTLAVLFPVVDLPRPSGTYPVGTTLMAFTDTSRAGAHTASSGNEPEGPESSAAKYRNIPVRIWYPASDTSGKQRANWMSNSELSRMFAECKNLPDILGQLTLIKTNSYLNAALSGQEAKYPVILFSGGGAMFNGQNVIQMEELASHGYIVCAVGHPYDDFVCEYPDGTIVPYDPQHLKALSEDIGNAIENAEKLYGEDGSNPEFIKYVLNNCTLNTADAINWSKDMSFVADVLTRLNSGKSTTNGEQNVRDAVMAPINADPGITDAVDMFAGKLDMERLGIFGHSFGGAAAGEACLRDNRFKAFINMDGTPFGTALDNVISQPFMILTTGKDEQKIIRNGYSADQKNFISVYLNGSAHMNFSDFNTVIPNIGKLTGLLGEIDSDRQRQIMNEYILVFFNSHLKGLPAPILEGGTPEYQEVLLEVN